MTERQYPRQAWVLMPSFKPKEITIVKRSFGYTSTYSGYDESDTGKDYRISDLFDSKGEAIAAGREKVKAMQADIDKRQATLNKRIAALDKAEKGGKC